MSLNTKAKRWAMLSMASRSFSIFNPDGSDANDTSERWAVLNFSGRLTGEAEPVSAVAIGSIFSSPVFGGWD